MAELTAVTRSTVLEGRYRVDTPHHDGNEDSVLWDGYDLVLGQPVRVLVVSGRLVAPVLDAGRRALLIIDERFARVLAVGEYKEQGYVVTPAVPGPSLAEVLATGPIVADQARALVGEAASAMTRAGALGFHHGYLGLQKIYVGGDKGIMIDGLALDHALAESQSPVNARTDTEDLVRVLYALLTGHWPGSDSAAGGVNIAPHDGERWAPPDTLNPTVPPDLDTLCSVTLSATDDGPVDPEELAGQLAPWPELLALDALHLPAPPIAQIDNPAEEPPVSDESQRPDNGSPPHASGSPARRSAFNSVPGPVPADDDRDGPSTAEFEPVQQSQPRRTPPPAAPMHEFTLPSATSQLDPESPQGIAAAIVAQEARQKEEAQQHNDYPDNDTAESSAPQRRFGATGIVLTLVSLAIIIAVVFSVRSILNLGSGSDAPFAAGTSSPPQTTYTASATPTPTPTPTREPTSTPTGPIAIGSLAIADPEGDGDEHPEALSRAIDSNPDTTWITRTYKDPKYGIKKGVGLVVNLEQRSMVHQVVLETNNQGGNVQIRNTTAEQPDGGTLLAEGPLENEVTFEFNKPVETTTLVLWFTELPSTDSGINRVELAEMQVS